MIETYIDNYEQFFDDMDLSEVELKYAVDKLREIHTVYCKENPQKAEHISIPYVEIEEDDEGRIYIEVSVDINYGSRVTYIGKFYLPNSDY